MTTVDLVCYKYKPLKNGELPIKVRICKDRKTCYINLGVSTKVEDWDFLNNCLKDSHPNKDEIENLISKAGKPMSPSDMNDFSSLCERCYMKEE